MIVVETVDDTGVSVSVGRGCRVLTTGERAETLAPKPLLDLSTALGPAARLVVV